MLTAAAILASRMAIVAFIVVSVSVVVARSGPMLGAMLAAIPISAGPAYVFIALDYDTDFVLRSTISSVLAVSGTAPFIVAHDLARRVTGTLGCFIAAVLALLGTLILVNHFEWTFGGAAAAGALMIIAGIVATRRSRREAPPFAVPSRPLDLAARALAVMSVVAATTILAALLGPRAAGYGALMPVVFMSFILVMQPRVGGAAIAGLFAHALFGILGFVPAFVALNLAAAPLGIWRALALALATSLAWNTGIVLLRRRGWLRI